MHKNTTIPSTYHQSVKYPLLEGQVTIATDNDPFLETEAYYANSRFSKAKRDQDKGKAVVEYDVQLKKIAPRSRHIKFIDL